MDDERIVSIPLEVVQRATGKIFRNRFVQLKINRKPVEEGVSLLAACEEGLFQADLTTAELRRAKTREDIDSCEWEAIVGYILNPSCYTFKPPPEGHDNVILRGKLLSSEDYDADTGVLCGEELSSEKPKFELFICTNDVLSVIYGTILFQEIDTGSLTSEEHNGVNMLTWMHTMAGQIQRLRHSLFETQNSLRESNRVIASKEQTISEMKTDYGLILADVEDRFFQLLASKRRRIAQLEGNSSESFEFVNEVYKNRQKNNLKLVHLEDIVVGEEYKHLRERRKKARTPGVREQVGSKVKVKDESSTVQEGTDVPQKTLPNIKLEDEYNGESSASGPMGHRRTSKSEAGRQVEASSTDYSEAEDADHVSPEAESDQAASGESDYENETEYSE